MKDTELYSKILDLPSSWEVTSVKMDIVKEEILVQVDYTHEESRCPKCGNVSRIYDYRKKRKWRHLDTCQMQTYIESRVPRIKCKDHGVLTMDIPWSENHSHFTLLFESFALKVLQSFRKQTKAAEILRISFDQIHYLMERAVIRGIERRDTGETIDYIGIDEKSIGKHHNYASILVDHRKSSVIEVIEGRREESAKLLLENNLSEEQLKNIKAITMDFWDPYISAVKSVLPNVDIVHDRFHLTKLLNKSVDEVRRQEVKTLKEEEKKVLKNTRYIFLQNPENWSNAYKMRFKEIQSINLATSEAWRIKENFRGFFVTKTISEATLYFTQWVLNAKEAKLTPVNKVVKTFLSYAEGILNYVKYHISNAIAESINSLIQEIKYLARGFRGFRNFRISVLFYLGKLDLFPHKTQ